MAQQKLRRRFHQDKPVPWNGRKRVKKKRGITPDPIPDGWGSAMEVRHVKRSAK